MKAVELFAGVGGLAMGVSNAGFTHEAVVEWNRDACQTIKYNQRRMNEPVVDWPVFQSDVRAFDFSELPEDIDLLAGGPPCQPFSIGGKHRGHGDDRNMFPEFIRFIRQLRPRAVLIENVRGLLRRSFSRYFEYIILQTTYPELASKKDENWADHLARLERHHTRGCRDGLFYRVVFQCLNAAAFGVPQRRERVFIVAIRCDQRVEYSFPSATHSEEALLHEQWVTGEYWERHAVSRRQRPSLPTGSVRRVEELRCGMLPPEHLPFRTVRDAFSDLPDPTKLVEEDWVLNHRLIPGARAYAGHTGSALDEPAKTLKAGDHGVPGGENMIAYPDGSVRYFTVREGARLQTFPDHYYFPCCWTESMRQLGNAVPVRLAEIVAKSISDSLGRAEK